MILYENKFVKEDIPWNGNRFLIGNGYFGIRGTFEEYTKEHMCAVNMAGIYDRAGEAWRESVNAPNPLYTYVIVNGKKYALPETEPMSHSQMLNFRYGIHSRETVWDTDEGRITIKSERFASMSRHHLIAMRYTFLADFICDTEIVTGIDSDVWDINGPHFVRTDTGISDGIIFAKCTTGEKHITVTVRESASAGFEHEETANTGKYSVLRKLCFRAEPNKEYTFEKTAEITTSEDKCNEPIEKLTYEELKAEHKDAWERIWDISEITIDGDDESMFALNYSIYHLNCIAPRGLKGRSIPARGLSGQVYKGAVFWDTEMFMIDYYIHSEPEIAKTLLRYRIDTIDGARAKAREYGFKGAYYAWESQEGGYEGCSDYNVTDVFTNRPMRTHFRDKQYHISSAVVYGFVKYIRATGDKSILSDGGMETILECARFYRSLLIRYADKTKYEIHDAVGPDEYHERVNNNVYTNRMAKLVFDKTLELLELFVSEYPQEAAELDKKYNLEKMMIMLKDSSENIFIKEPDKNGIIEQFDRYFELEDVSIDEVRSRLLNPREYWGGTYGVASQTQIIKQADVAAMLSIFYDEYDTETERRNFEYYEPRTEHGSSLSACMYSLLACRIGRKNTAYDLFLKSARADLVKGGKEWAGLIYIGGTHPASAGGAWIVAVNGFAGIKEINGELICEPSLPDKWKKMSFKLMFRNRLYKIEIKDGKGTVTEL